MATKPKASSRLKDMVGKTVELVDIMQRLHRAKVEAIDLPFIITVENGELVYWNVDKIQALREIPSASE